MINNDVFRTYGNGYDSKKRFVSYWHQIYEIMCLNPSSVLEVGIGNKFVVSYLEKLGVNVTTLDIEKELCPDVNSSVLNMPFKKKCFDVCLCSEVLEHLPFENFQDALVQMRRVCRLNLVLSLPDTSLCFGIKVSAPISLQTNLISLPRFVKIKQIFDGYHYWEIGKKGYELKKVKNVIFASGFKILKTYRVFDNPYHRFFILSRFK